MECFLHPGLCSERHTCVCAGMTITLILQKRKLRQEKVKSLKPHNESTEEPAFALKQSDSRACKLNSGLYHLPSRPLPLPCSFHWLTQPTSPPQSFPSVQSPLMDAVLHFPSNFTWYLERSSYYIFSIPSIPSLYSFLSCPHLYIGL